MYDAVNLGISQPSCKAGNESAERGRVNARRIPPPGTESRRILVRNRAMVTGAEVQPPTVVLGGIRNQGDITRTAGARNPTRTGGGGGGEGATIRTDHGRRAIVSGGIGTVHPSMTTRTIQSIGQVVGDTTGQRAGGMGAHRPTTRSGAGRRRRKTRIPWKT